MSPLVITVVLVFTAGAFGFFLGCMFASWLGGATDANKGAALAANSDLAPDAATPTASDPSTFVMSYKDKASEPDKISAVSSEPAAKAVAPAAKPEITTSSKTRTAEPAPTPPSREAAPAKAATMSSSAKPAPAAVSASSTAAGSANPAVTPLRGPLAIARAAPKGEGATKKKSAKSPSRSKPASKPAAAKKKTSKISIAASKPKAATKSAGTAKPKAAAKPSASKPTPAMPGETQAKKPRFLPKPRKGGADDLKRIKGVGPSLEATLNGLGVFHYNQVSKWTPENVMWVDDHLKFKGRIARDNWLDQAAKLDAGEVTEFASRVDKGAVASSKGKAGRNRS